MSDRAKSTQIRGARPQPKSLKKRRKFPLDEDRRPLSDREAVGPKKKFNFGDDSRPKTTVGNQTGPSFFPDTDGSANERGTSKSRSRTAKTTALKKGKGTKARSASKPTSDDDSDDASKKPRGRRRPAAPAARGSKAKTKDDTELNTSNRGSSSSKARSKSVQRNPRSAKSKYKSDTLYQQSSKRDLNKKSKAGDTANPNADAIASQSGSVIYKEAPSQLSNRTQDLTVDIAGTDGGAGSGGDATPVMESPLSSDRERVHKSSRRTGASDDDTGPVTINFRDAGNGGDGSPGTKLRARNRRAQSKPKPWQNPHAQADKPARQYAVKAQSSRRPQPNMIPGRRGARMGDGGYGASRRHMSKPSESRGLGALIEQAAKMEGLDADPAVQRMLNRLTDAFGSADPQLQRLMENEEDQLAGLLKKSKSAKRQMRDIDSDLDAIASGTATAPQRVKHAQPSKRYRGNKAGGRKRGGKSGRNNVRNKIKKFDALSNKAPQFRSGRKGANLNVPKPGGRHRRRVSGGADAFDLRPGQNSPGTSPINMSGEFPEMSAEVGGMVSGLESEADSDSINTDASAESDPLEELRVILKKEPKERSDMEIDHLVSYFEDFQILPAVIDKYSGKATFRAFIQETRYRKILPGKYIFEQGDPGAEFFFIIKGNVSVLVNEDLDKTSVSSPAPQPTATHTTIELDGVAVDADKPPLNGGDGGPDGDVSQRLSTASRPSILGRGSILRRKSKTDDRPRHDTFETIKRKEVATLAYSNVFGEIAVEEVNSRRTATCVARSITELAFWTKETYDKYIKPIKDGQRIREKVLLDPETGKLLDENALIQKAALFLDDAIQKRDLKMHRHGYWPRFVHKLTNSYYFRVAMYVTSLTLLGLIFVEPSCYGDGKYDDSVMAWIGLEWIIFFVLAMECAMRVYSFGPLWFFQLTVHRLRVIFLGTMFLDLLIATALEGDSFRFSRIIRPGFLLLFSRNLRQVYRIAIYMVPKVLQLIMLFFVFLAIFARVSVHIFTYSREIFNRTNFEDGLAPYRYLEESCDAASCNPTYVGALNGESENCCIIDESAFVSWNGFWSSMLSLFVLLSTENYPDVFWPAWMVHHFYWSFFAVFLLIGTFFLLNLFAAVVYDAYHHITEELDVEDEARESRALQTAWRCLDDNLSQTITRQKFRKLMKYLKPDYGDFECKVLFRLMGDDNNTGLIDEEDFSFNMINIMFLSIKRQHNKPQERQDLVAMLPLCLNTYGYDIINLFDSSGYELFKCVLILIDVFALLFYHEFLSFAWLTDTCLAFVFLLCQLFEYIFTHALQFDVMWSTDSAKFEFVLSVIHGFAAVAGCVDDHFFVSSFRFLSIVRLVHIFRFALAHVKSLRNNLSYRLTLTILRMIPIFGLMVVSLVVGLIYVFTVIGMELFFDPQRLGIDRCSGAEALRYDPYALFCDAQITVITLFQVLSTNNWHYITYKAMEKTGNPFVSLYFCAFFFFGPIVMLNILLAEIFTMFFEVNTMQKEAWAMTDLYEAEEATKKAQQQTGGGNAVHFGGDADGGPPNALSTQMELQQLGPHSGQHPNQEGVFYQDGRHWIHTPVSDGEREYNLDTGAGARSPLNIMSLKDFARKIHADIALRDYVVNGVQLTDCFTGKQAVQYLIDRNMAPDEEEAVDYLSQIMDKEGAIERVDPGSNATFENAPDAYYKWIVQRLEDDDEADLGVSGMSEIMIGLRHTYAGYQHMMKMGRREKKLEPQHGQIPVVSNIGAAPSTTTLSGGGGGGGGDHHKSDTHTADKSTLKRAATLGNILTGGKSKGGGRLPTADDDHHKSDTRDVEIGMTRAQTIPLTVGGHESKTTLQSLKKSESKTTFTDLGGSGSASSGHTHGSGTNPQHGLKRSATLSNILTGGKNRDASTVPLSPPKKSEGKGGKGASSSSHQRPVSAQKRSSSVRAGIKRSVSSKNLVLGRD